MRLISSPSFQPRSSLKEAIPYSSAALRQDLERLRGVWNGLGQEETFRSAFSARYASEFSDCGSTSSPHKSEMLGKGLDPGLRSGLPTSACSRAKPDP
jgi:hypothetical protein